MFCANPFTDLQINTSGDVLCCCEEWLPFPLGNLLTDRLEDIWNGRAAKQIRRSVCDGNFEFCVCCQHLPGPRNTVTEAPDPTIQIAPDLSVHRIRTLMLNYDRSCNLACPSCRRRSFKSDINEVQRIHQAMLASGVLKRSDNIYVTASGDPFSSPTFYQFLMSLPVLAPHLPRVILHTNGLLLDRSHWENLGNTRELVDTIIISVDASTERTYRINRGGNWRELWKNIEFASQLRREGKIRKLAMRYVIQDNNVDELIPFCQLVTQYQTDDISAYHLRNWGTFTEVEYRQRAVHLPDHPRHQNYVAVMTSPYLTTNRCVILPCSGRLDE